MFNTLKIYMTLTVIYYFVLKKMKSEKFEKLVANLHDNTEYVIHIRNLKQELYHGLALIKFIESLNLIRMLA